MEPISPSSFSVQAAPSVTARSASITLMRCVAPSTRPVAVSRFTAHQAVNSGASGVMGASEWMENGTPVSSAVRQAFMRSARSGPTVTSRCWSPQ